MNNWRHYDDPLWAGGGKTVCMRCKFAFADGVYHHVDEWRYCPMCGAGMSFETNADRIRAMTDEELADMINELLLGCFYTKTPIFITYHSGTSEILKWLKEEAEE